MPGLSFPYQSATPTRWNPHSRTRFNGSTSTLGEHGVSQNVSYVVVVRKLIFASSRGKRSPDWLAKVDKILRRLETLQPGWDTYSAPAPSHFSIQQARTFVGVLHNIGFAPGRVAPSAIGGVGITFRNASKEAYIEFRNDETTYLVLADVPNDPLVEPVRSETESLRQTAHQIREFLNA